ncbi:MAG: hypothetical protein R3B84_08850 [Zavarzinella sp.]
MMRSWCVFEVSLACLGLVFPTCGQEKPAEQKKVPDAMNCLTIQAPPGKTTKLVIRGLNLDQATSVTIHEPKSRAMIIGKAQKKTPNNPLTPAMVGDTEITVEVTIHAECPQSLVPISFRNGDVAGKSCNVLVAEEPAIPEKESNGSFRSAMKIELNQSIRGKIQSPKDVDVFQATLEANQAVFLKLSAAQTGSPLAAQITIYDAKGQIIKILQSSRAATDPEMKWIPKIAGDYFFSIIDLNDFGADMFVYQFLLATTDKSE